MAFRSPRTGVASGPESGEPQPRDVTELQPHAGSGARRVSGTPVWLKLQPEPIYGVLHMPSSRSQARVAVLILPTFGWDSDCSYRARRDWATQLAQAGIAAARIDFPGTENSVGSPLAPNRLASWIDSADQAARWLRAASGCERLVAIGIGLGGLIAHQAAAEGGPIDDLILWGTRATGRACVREMRAYATVASGELLDEPEAPRDGVVSIAGHVISEETVDALNAISIAGVPLPHAERRRVLLIGRDAHGIDSKLHEHFASSGADLTVLEANDYESLMALPELRMTPSETISASIAWLNDTAVEGLEPILHPQSRPAPETTDCVEFMCDGVGVRERICELHTPRGRLVGIVSAPLDPTEVAGYCLVAVNSGELRHTGPNRILVEVARQAAAGGVPMARVDLPGLGDSDGDSVRTFNRTFEDDAEILCVVEDIYEHVRLLGIADRFVPVGLCLGAYYAIRAVLHSSRSVGAIAINPPAFRWTRLQQSTLRRGLIAIAPDAVAPVRDHSRLAMALKPATARITAASHRFGLYARRRLAHWTVLWRFARRAGAADARETLERLAGSGTPVLLLLSEDEPVLRLLDHPKLAARVAEMRNVDVQLLPTHDHILRPLPSQEATLDRISAALREFLPRNLRQTSERHA
jgi:alpha-beta hydrolase superfamily lysophospholipase